MYQSQIAVRYAKSLFLFAKEKNLLDDIIKDVNLIHDTINENEELSSLLEHPVIKPSQKIEALATLFKEEINPITQSFLKLIIQNKREIYIKRISQNFIDIYKKNMGIHSAILTTAYKLSKEEKEKLAKTIEVKTGSTLELIEKVDDSIIGGFILQIDDKELDISVLKQLQRYKSNLLEIDLNAKKKKK